MFVSAQESQEVQSQHSQEKPKRIPLSLGLGLLLILNVVIDQITKVIAENKLMVWTSPTDLKSYQGMRHALGSLGDHFANGGFYFDFAFTYVRNQGAAWGFLSDMPDQFRIPFFYIVSAVAISMIVNYIRTTPQYYR